MHIQDIPELMTEFRTIMNGHATFPVNKDPDKPSGRHPQAFGLNQLHSFCGENGFRQFPDFLPVFLNILFHKKSSCRCAQVPFSFLTFQKKKVGARPLIKRTYR
jgi:hypothetical protein